MNPKHLFSTLKSQWIACIRSVAVPFSAVTLAGTATAWAQAQEAVEPPEADVVRLQPVIVAATRVATEAERVPGALFLVAGDDTGQGRQSVHLDDALSRVPGGFVQNEFNFAQDLRISIRGFGARSAGGIRGIQIYLDGMPLPLLDGQSALDLVDPDVDGRLEVMRGPISPLYGTPQTAYFIATPVDPGGSVRRSAQRNISTRLSPAFGMRSLRLTRRGAADLSVHQVPDCRAITGSSNSATGILPVSMRLTMCAGPDRFPWTMKICSRTKLTQRG